MRHQSAIVATTLLLLASCGPKKPKDELPNRPVTVTPVKTGERVERVEVVGELLGIEEVRVFAQVPERVSTLAVKEGDVVRRGDLIATVVGDLQGEARSQAQAGLEAALASRDAVTDNLKRTRMLVEGGGGTQSQLETLEAQSRAAEAQVRQATAALGAASAQQSRTIVRSPIAGVVSQLAVRVGDLASPGVPIATIVRDDRVKAVLRVPEREFLRVREGMKARVAPLARPDMPVDGKVTLRAAVVDRTTRTGLVEVHLPNPQRLLLAGSAIRVTIEIERRSGVVLVPAEAVLLSAETERTGRATAFVSDGKLAHRRDVQVGVRQGSELEIVRGLTAGEQLVVQGVHLLRDGNPITLVRKAGEKKG